MKEGKVNILRKNPHKSDAVCALRNRDPDEILFNYVLKLSILKFRLFSEEKKIIKKINKWISLMLSDT